MKVAEDNVINFNTIAPRVNDFPVRDLSVGLSGRAIYAAQRIDRGEEHDGRGLAMAILLCTACWAALGYFLLM